MNKLHYALSAVLMLAVSGCSAGERWDGYVYPDRKNLLMYRSAGEFPDLGDCETASMNILKSLNALQGGYYECRKNCKAGSAHYESNCEENVRGNYYK